LFLTTFALCHERRERGNQNRIARAAVLDDMSEQTRFRLRASEEGSGLQRAIRAEWLE
jgi:hypothetical protein